ncbi:hypothetical protein GCM10008171_01660 [Methylopila jiangsuensis]|uniref:Uncharacterized protein n=1 Tax=Methylopila jiangsuensis TaxID=586230 RepID=A0A9W6JEQ0_9HYPH|nr:hypothetical protein [Methylopila jiangsuensis]MDR6287333.1 hypothetical protein [Methylopila jiangsuensis]GLK74913.1 hypothetical protein GCM10008171_01660 [Methylopila jiangsuensis]
MKEPWYRDFRRRFVEAKKGWQERKRLKDLAEAEPYSETLDAV